MACNFRADQYQAEFTAQRLGNWQVPKWHPAKPLARTHPTKIISNDRGHLLPGIPRPSSNPWGHFKSTWQMPDKISRYQANQLSAPQPCQSRWAKPSKERPKTSAVVDDPAPVQETQDYLPGDLTKPSERHPTRKLLEDQRKNKARNYSPPLELNDLNLQQHDCNYSDGCPLPIDKRRPASPHLLDDCPEPPPTDDTTMRRDVTEKPGEWDAPPMVPASWNFEAARKMAVENLEHQPLPDAIMDKAFRRVQALGARNPELALNVVPTATGVGVKTYMAGPTQCTKLRIYRPKTCGVVPQPLDRTRYAGHQQRPHTCHQNPLSTVKLGAMDLAIQWDHRPADPRDEPRRAAHIDGTDDSPGPAIFTVVKTPRTPTSAQPPLGGHAQPAQRSGGVFANTTGENDFFDADIVRRAAPFGTSATAAERSCRCATSAAQAERFQRQHYTLEALDRMDADRHRSRAKLAQHSNNAATNESHRRCKSSPNLSQIVNVGSVYPTNDNDHHKSHHHHHHHHHHQRHASGHDKQAHKTHRLCDERVASAEPNRAANNRPPTNGSIKPPFKTGTPNSNASGTCSSFDSGCSSAGAMTTAGGSSAASSFGCNGSSKTSVRVPKMRHPYTKRDYAIETLAPPFACWRGGAGQGGYPEHWRLASVYQHAYKPIEQRRRPLLATVYQ